MLIELTDHIYMVISRDSVHGVYGKGKLKDLTYFHFWPVTLYRFRRPHDEGMAIIRRTTVLGALLIALLVLLGVPQHQLAIVVFIVCVVVSIDVLLWIAMKARREWISEEQRRKKSATKQGKVCAILT